MRYELDDRFTRTTGQVYLSAIDALVRLPIEQARRDRAAGLRTEGFISGYRGSPLGGFDLAAQRSSSTLRAAGVRFEPGLNEDLAATAIWGTQQSSLMSDATVDGVFGLWFGKGPGVDRSTDALKHGNHAGSSRHGGVLIVAGDDPGARSSTLAHQSEPVLLHCSIPILSPATPLEILQYGLHGWAMSRYSGSWVALRCVTDLLDSAATIDAGFAGEAPTLPPEDGLDVNRHIRWNAPPLELERLVADVRLPAISSYVRANGLDYVAFGDAQAPHGIVTVGKSYLDVRQALDLLEIDEERARALGLAVYKVAMPWPLEAKGVRAFADAKQDLLIVEEKRSLIEDQVASLLYGDARRPRLLGKLGADRDQLLPVVGETSPDQIAEAIARWLTLDSPAGIARAPRRLEVKSPLTRAPAFCAGCPHNTSTVVVDGSVAFGGIGCHGMAVSMPDRRTLAHTHMGGEGANWIGMSSYTATDHVFQNMGDGTFVHSGSLAIRASVAAGVNMTYKILANGAVAMTGGQPIEGHTIEAVPLVSDIVGQLLAENVSLVVVVSDKPEQYGSHRLPAPVDVVHRDRLDEVERRLRATRGVTALVYDQTCSAEARRLRKRKMFDEPDMRVLINTLVCEGCGDCNTESNCIAVEPDDTEFGRKRRINQSSCNKDFSCLKGYCPSFAVVSGAKLRQPTLQRPASSLLDALPTPSRVEVGMSSCNVLVAGIGGTGVVTLGAVLGMAAHLDGRAATVLDVTGVAQKNGSVTSHIRVAASSDQLHARRLPRGTVDLLIACDLVVAADMPVASAMRRDRTTAVVDADVLPTADFANSPDLDLSNGPMMASLERVLGRQAISVLSARSVARDLVGDEIASNMVLLGFALQRGLLPVGVASLERAIQLNAVAVDLNLAALRWGRIAAHDWAAVNRALGAHGLSESDQLDPLEHRRRFLVDYQSEAYAESYVNFVRRVRQAESEITSESRLSTAVMHGLFRLMAYKDEYEVARLYCHPDFTRQLRSTFEDGYRLQLQLAPQRLFGDNHAADRPRKRTFGPWILPVFRVLRHLRFLRGTPFDLFGRTAHRRQERYLVDQYRADISTVVASLTPARYDLAVRLAELPERIRGFGTVKDATIRETETVRMTLMADLALTPSDSPNQGGS